MSRAAPEVDCYLFLLCDASSITMDSNDELPHWSVLIRREFFRTCLCVALSVNASFRQDQQRYTGIKNKEATLRKRIASSSPTSSLKAKTPSRSPAGRTRGKVRALYCSCQVKSLIVAFQQPRPLLPSPKSSRYYLTMNKPSIPPPFGRAAGIQSRLST